MIIQIEFCSGSVIDFVAESTQVTAVFEFMTTAQGLAARRSVRRDLAEGVEVKALANSVWAGYKAGMAVVGFEIPVAGMPAISCAGIVVVAAVPGHPLSDLEAVVAGGDDDPAEAEMSPRAAGLAAELTSRPGREAWAWIARTDAPESRPVGLVTLVHVGSPHGPRWSIGWLVVDRASRRRGIGTALVATAVRFAGARGASVVHAETLDRWPGAVAFWRTSRLAAVHRVTTLGASGESRKTAEG